MGLDSDIALRLADVRRRIAAAATAGGRNPADIRLIAVSKTFGVEHVRAAAQAGQIDFGENRVQEALQKITASTDLLIRWHLVGHLQSNKARRAARVFTCVHSIDRLELLEAYDAAAVAAGTSSEVLVQVDLAGEATKYGARPHLVEPLFDGGRRCQAVRLVGLMLLPPYSANPEEVRPYFQRLRELRDQLKARGVDPAMLRELSMGMSHDFEAAVEEGATMVRVGTAIFGKRDA